jgi:DNA ligase (NAD+)
MMDKNIILNDLTKILNFMKTTEDFEKTKLLLDFTRIKSLVNYYIHTEENISSNIDTAILGTIISILQFVYNNSTDEIISDEDYDLLYEIYISQSNHDIVGSPNLKNRIIRHHVYTDLRGTLKKAHFITNKEKGKDPRWSIESFIQSIERTIGRPLTNKEAQCELFPKFDGISIVFELDEDGYIEHALTRGHTDINEAVDVTPIFPKTNMNDISNNKGTRCGIKTEVIMKYSDYADFCEKYGNFRSPQKAISSIFNTLEYNRENLKYVTIVPLRIQNFNTKKISIANSAYKDYPYDKCDIRNTGALRKKIDTIKRCMKCIHDVPIDGVVIYMTDPYIQEVMGRKDNINKYEIAFKFPPEQKKSKIIAVDFQIGLLGSITPVAKVEPIKMENNNVVKSICIGSIDIFNELNIRIGDEVIVKYEITPTLYKDDSCAVGDGELVSVPTHCEYCKNELDKVPVLRCTNPECPSLMIGRIANYITKLKISDIGVDTITTLFKEGILTSIEDLYNLKNKKNDIIQLRGYGEKSYKIIIDSIDKRRDVSDYEMLGAIGIIGVASKTFKKILNIYYIDELIDICINSDLNKLMNIKSIGSKIAPMIIIGIKKNLPLIKFLQGELTCKHETNNYSLTVLFSNIRDRDFENYLIENKNVNVVDSYIKKIDLLIVKDESSNGDKVRKAKRDNKKIMTIEEAYKMFDYKAYD